MIDVFKYLKGFHMEDKTRFFCAASANRTRINRFYRATEMWIWTETFSNTQNTFVAFTSRSETEAGCVLPMRDVAEGIPGLVAGELDKMTFMF